MTPRTIKRIRWGIVSMLLLAVAALAVGSVGTKAAKNEALGRTPNAAPSVWSWWTTSS